MRIPAIATLLSLALSACGGGQPTVMDILSQCQFKTKVKGTYSYVPSTGEITSRDDVTPEEQARMKACLDNHLAAAT